MALSKEINGHFEAKRQLQIREEKFTFYSQKMELLGSVIRIDERTRKQQVAATYKRSKKCLAAHQGLYSASKRETPRKGLGTDTVVTFEVLQRLKNKG